MPLQHDFTGAQQRIEDHIQATFPRTIGILPRLDYSDYKTYHAYVNEYCRLWAIEATRIREYAELESTVEINDAWLHRKNGRGFEVIRLASAIAGKPIGTCQAVEEVREALANKRILSLGDDTGSLTEILKSFGCDTVGIECDPVKVAIANAGYFDEHRAPRPDVIQGDIWSLLTQDPVLSKHVTPGSFDAIISVDLWNGSGAEEPRGQSARLVNELYGLDAHREWFPSKPDDFFTIFIKETLRYLRPGGVEVHLGRDVEIQNPYRKELVEAKALELLPSKITLLPDIAIRRA